MTTFLLHRAALTVGCILPSLVQDHLQMITIQSPTPVRSADNITKLTTSRFLSRNRNTSSGKQLIHEKQPIGNVCGCTPAYLAISVVTRFSSPTNRANVGKDIEFP